MKAYYMDFHSIEVCLLSFIITRDISDRSYHRTKMERFTMLLFVCLLRKWFTNGKIYNKFQRERETSFIPNTKKKHIFKCFKAQQCNNWLSNNSNQESQFKFIEDELYSVSLLSTLIGKDRMSLWIKIEMKTLNCFLCVE